MNNTLKRTSILFAALLVMAIIISLGAQKANASREYYFSAPAEGATFKAGNSVSVSFYAGVVHRIKHISGGSVSYVEYKEMPLIFKVFKGSTELYKKEFSYTRGQMIKTKFTPGTTGTLKLKIYGLPLNIKKDEPVLQDTMTIKVKKKKAKAVKKIKPVIKVKRTGDKTAKITCTNDCGFGIKYYRATKENGKYKLIMKSKNPVFTDKKLTATKAYYYKVKLYAKSGKKKYTSKWSKIKKADKSKDAQNLIPRVTLTYKGSYGVLVKWKCDSDVDRFYVLRTIDPEEKGGDLLANVSDNTFSYYDNNWLESGETYYYYVMGIKNPDSDHPTKYFSKQYHITIP